MRSGNILIRGWTTGKRGDTRCWWRIQRAHAHTIYPPVGRRIPRITGQDISQPGAPGKDPIDGLLNNREGEGRGVLNEGQVTQDRIACLGIPLPESP